MKKNILKISAMIVALLVIALFSTTVKAATEEPVEDEEALKSAISEAQSEEGQDYVVIKLGKDIELSSTLTIDSGKIIIDGQGKYTISPKSEWKSSNTTTGDQSLITVSSNGDVQLKDLKLKDAVKYGVQAYNGGKVALDGVDIRDCTYGAVLVNGGTVTINELNLGHNGKANENNGIEIGQGQNVTSKPTLVMDGTLTSSETENVINIAENDELKDFSVQNTDKTEDKLYVTGKTITVTDENNEVKYVSNEAKSGVTATDVTEGETQVNKYIVTVKYNNKVEKFVVSAKSKLSSIKGLEAIKKSAPRGKVFSKFVDVNNYEVKESKEIVKDLTITAVYVNKPVEDKKDPTPNTGVENVYAVAGLFAVVSLAGIVVLNKRK